MIKEIKEFFKENYEYRKNILPLAISNAKSDTNKTTLGMAWIIIRDAVFFITYGLFMSFIRPGSSLMNGMPLLIYLFTGLVAWYFINDFITQGVNCILKNKGIFTKLKFPILTIPTYETLAICIKRLPTLGLLAAILIFFMLTSDYRVNINIFGLLYSFFAIFIFGLSFVLLFSGFYSISKDFRELYRSIMRIQFYFVPIFWSVSEVVTKIPNLPSWTQGVLENLPFIHIVESFRNSISLNQFPPLLNIGIFLLITFIIFALGCYVQYRLRRIYSDFV